MKPTIRLGRIFGIEVGVNWSLVVIAGLLTLGLTAGTGGGPGPWIVAALTVVAFFASLLAHELAHSVVARRNGMSVTGITLWLLGGVAQLGGPMPSAGAELRIAAAGPATSFALAFGFAGVTALGIVAGLSDLVLSGFAWLALVNVILAVFNLIPAAPLDGGRILAALLWAHHGDRTRADVTATRAGQAVGIAMITAGIVGTFLAIPFLTLWTALLGWFVYTAATAEQRHARLTGALGDLRVRDVMSPSPQTARGWVTVDAFAHEAQVQPVRHHVLPVESWEGGIAGLVTLDALRAVPPDRRSSTRVVDVAVPLHLVTTAAPDERVVDLVQREPSGPLPYVLVFELGRLVGILSSADLQRAAQLGELRPSTPSTPSTPNAPADPLTPPAPAP